MNICQKQFCRKTVLYENSKLNFKLPATKTDDEYLYLLKSRYSRMSSLIIIFSLLRGGFTSLWSSRALNTSARILAFICPSEPRFSRVSFMTESINNNTGDCNTDVTFF